MKWGESTKHMKNERKIYCFLGLPGSGKGTQAELLAEEIGAVMFETGDMIREEISSCDLTDPFCVEIKQKYEKGIPQPDEVVFDIIQKRLTATNKSVIFDNFPFSEKQAELFIKYCKDNHISNPSLIIINIDKDTSINRIVHRKVCSGCGEIYIDKESTICEKCGNALITRSDDNIETVENRINYYQPRINETRSIFVSNGYKIIEINGEQSVKEVYKQIKKRIS